MTYTRAMRPSRLFSMVLAALVVLGAHGASAGEGAPIPVAVDWKGVSDLDAERCGLGRLRAAAIERLVGDGYAVVESAGEGGIFVGVTSSGGALGVRVEGKGVARAERLDTTGCDSTFVLAVTSRIAELVAEVARERKTSPPPAPTSPTLEPAPAAPPSPVSNTGVRGEIDVTGRINTSPDWLLGGGVAVRGRASAGWELGGRAEVAANGHLGVTVTEVFLGASFAFHPKWSGLGPCVEVGPLLHHATSDVLTVTRLDASLSAGGELALGPFFAQVMLQGRLGSFEHRVGSEVAYQTGRFGAVFRLGGQLSGS
jgi:hypothetical protein